MKNSNLIILALSLLMFSRLAEYVLNLPSVINMIHFPFILILFILYYKKSPKKLFMLLILLLFVIIISAILNSAGIINIILEFILLSEPILLLIFIERSKLNESEVRRITQFLILIGILQIPFSYYQWFVHNSNADFVRGIFLGMNAGAHVVSAIIFVCIVLIIYINSLNTKQKIITISFLFSVIALTDAKQVVLALIISLLILAVLEIKSRKLFVRYSIIFISIVIALFYLGNIMYPNSNYLDKNFWQQGFNGKMIAFSVFNEYVDSTDDWLLGFGPGHTVGRLAFMLPEYPIMLDSFGATTSTITSQVFIEQQNNYLTNSITGSSVFSPFFSFAGILGDLGILGLSMYLLILICVFLTYCSTPHSKFILIFVCILGLIFEWLEEPNFVLYSFSTIAIIYKSQELKKK